MQRAPIRGVSILVFAQGSGLFEGVGATGPTRRTNMRLTRCPWRKCAPSAGRTSLMVAIISHLSHVSPYGRGIPGPALPHEAVWMGVLQKREHPRAEWGGGAEDGTDRGLAFRDPCPDAVRGRCDVRRTASE